jgi:ribosome assembly protein YihI (activator of Der GTPase)
MAKKGGSAPPPPDPRETAAAQTANNIGTAIANTTLGNVNQYTPYGSLTYEQRTNPNYDPNFQAPEITTSTQSVTTPGSGPKPGGWTPGDGGGLSGPTTQQQTLYNVGDKQFGNLDEATAYQKSLNPQAQTYRYVDPNDGSVYEIPMYDAIQKLSPEQQKLLETQQGAEQNLAELARDQSGRIGGLLSDPMTLDGLPAGGQADAAQTQRFMDERNANRIDSVQQASGLSGDFGNVQSSVPGQQYQTGFNQGNPVQGSVGGQNFQTGFGDAGAITRSYGTDFSQDRQKVEDALMSRLNPSLERDRESLRTSLLNQGVREGSEAFDRAMNRFGEQSNDARMQAVLAGGQEQSRMADLEARRAGFENAAQQQAYQQAQGRGGFANDARGQQLQADLARGQFANNATAQQFGQNQAAAGFTNQAKGQQFQTDLAGANFGNQAQAQRFGQGAVGQELSNNAAAQNNAAQFQLAGLNTSLTNQNEASMAALRGEQDADRQTGLQEAFALRNQPINEIGALLGTGQVQQPNFVNPNVAQIPTVDRAGLEMQSYNQQLAAWQQNQQKSQGLMGGLLGAGGQLGAAAIMSDRRMKRDIRRVGAYRRLPIYEYRYADERLGQGVQVGFMADDVARIAPEAVAVMPGGFMGVDYVKAMEAA